MCTPQYAQNLELKEETGTLSIHIDIIVLIFRL